MKIHIKSFKLAPILGIGYWKDKYMLEDIKGYTHNIVLRFFRIQIGLIYKDML